MLGHDEKPERGELSDDDIQRIEQITTSSYFKHVEDLRSYVVGRKVISSVVGSSGYLLYLDDDSWVLSYFDDEKFDWRVGLGKPSAADLSLLTAISGADSGRNLLAVDLPYADEVCDIEMEVAQAHGKPIVNLSIGESNFSFCFPKGRELDVMLFPSDDGRSIWRVFWEQ